MTKEFLLVLLFSCTLAACGQLLFKSGANGAVSLLDFLNVRVIAGIFAYGVSTLLWIWTLSRMPLVFVYPFTMLTFVLVYAGSIIILKERFPLVGIAGIALILIGLLFVIRSSAN